MGAGSSFIANTFQNDDALIDQLNKENKQAISEYPIDKIDTLEYSKESLCQSNRGLAYLQSEAKDSSYSSVQATPLLTATTEDKLSHNETIKHLNHNENKGIGNESAGDVKHSFRLSNPNSLRASVRLPQISETNDTLSPQTHHLINPDPTTHTNHTEHNNKTHIHINNHIPIFIADAIKTPSDSVIDSSRSGYQLSTRSNYLSTRTPQSVNTPMSINSQSPYESEMSMRFSSKVSYYLYSYINIVYTYPYILNIIY